MHEAELREFERRFGRAPEAAARAPGRVNLLGEHTDYNEGLVLPCAVDRDTRVLLARRDDGRVCASSRERAGDDAVLRAAHPERRGHWSDHVGGVLFALAERDVRLPGLDLRVASDVPPGAGLSSSAALELAVVTAVDALLGLGLSAEARARLAHRAETAFVGVPCGVMDQFACGLGRRDAALRIDCRTSAVEPVPFPGERAVLLVAHSGVSRELAGGAYARRRAECEEAFAAARAAGVVPPTATALRDVSPQSLAALERALPSSLFRRARHVVRENRRVDALAAALRAGDVASAGALLREGMESLRRDFEVSCPELDALCEIADAVSGVYGSRLTGAGFGGCTLHLVAPEAADAAAEALAEGFAERFGRRPPVWRVRPAEGASVLVL